VYVDPSGHIPCIDGNCEYQDEILNRSPGVFYRLPVGGVPIQPFGGTKFAWDHRETMYEYSQGIHPGMDFIANWGEPVYAGVYGTVISYTYGSCSNGTCNYTYCDSSGCGPADQEDIYEGPFNVMVGSGGYVIKYGHLSRVNVHVGDKVTPDTIIGYVGNMSGDPKGGNNHLHLEVRRKCWGGPSVDPTLLMAPNVAALYKEQLLSQNPIPIGSSDLTDAQYPGGLFFDPYHWVYSPLPFPGKDVHEITRNTQISWWLQVYGVK
jgi:murein DD-endopeptidase MepM/ murein hydrolase activator NlpD